jgi:NADPH-dependent 2,4-dienoyl-CoA reductase/sulfur reductase-like enzyme
MADQVDLVVVGGGPAGLSAAKAYREAGGRGRVRLLSADTEPPYDRPPLSKDFLRGEVGDADLPMESADFYARRGIELGLADPVTNLDPEAQVVVRASGTPIEYGDCVLATGAEPVRPPVPGVDHPEVRTLRTAADSRRLRDAARRSRTAVVVGSGFIGCEAAVSLSRLGVDVTLLTPESLPQEARLGEAAGRRIARWLRAEGVRPLVGTELAGIEDGRHVETASGDALDTDLVLLATGIAPCSELAEKAGLDLHGGRVRVDEHLRSAVPGVLACGDVALAYNVSAQRALPVEHWGEAVTMGEIAGRTAAGASASWSGVPGFWSVIGDRVLKYAAWGDAFDHAEIVEHGPDAFTVWYGQAGRTVGVLTHQADEDHKRGARLVEWAAPLPV